MAEWLAPAKVDYACSAHFMDHIEALNLSADQRKFLAAIPDAHFRETVRDYIVNQQFRRDYWVKGVRTLTPLQQAEQLQTQAVVLLMPRADVSLKIQGYAGEGSLQADIYDPVLDALADHQPCDLVQLQARLQGKDISLAQLLQAVVILCAKNVLLPAQGAQVQAHVRTRCEKLNSHLTQLARINGNVSHLASPITGGAIVVPRFEQLFLLLRSQGAQTPEDWAAGTWQILATQNQRIMKDGNTIDAPEENLAELNRQAHVFAQKRLATLKALGVAA
jgi:hypothetical protein